MVPTNPEPPKSLMYVNIMVIKINQCRFDDIMGVINNIKMYTRRDVRTISFFGSGSYKI